MKRRGGGNRTNEFGRTAERPLPKEPEQPPKQRPSVALILSMPDGTQRPTTFQEAEKMFCNFPVADTPEELAKIDDDDLGSNDNENRLSPNESPS